MLQLYKILYDFGKNWQKLVKTGFYHCPGKNRFLPAKCQPWFWDYPWCESIIVSFQSHFTCSLPDPGLPPNQFQDCCHHLKLLKYWQPSYFAVLFPVISLLLKLFNHYVFLFEKPQWWVINDGIKIWVFFCIKHSGASSSNLAASRHHLLQKFTTHNLKLVMQSGLKLCLLIDLRISNR